MGTRNLTCIVKNGEYKVAKYGQWDGYLSGLGVGILSFLKKDFEKTKFEKGLNKIKPISDDNLKKLWIEAGASPDSDLVNIEVSNKFHDSYPYLSRDCSGHELLKLIQQGKVRWQSLNVGFAADSLFCEWCYVIDLDKNTFEVYKGFNETPLPKGQRFADLPLEKYRDGKTKYYPVALFKIYKLSRLPSCATFLKLDKQC